MCKGVFGPLLGEETPLHPSDIRWGELNSLWAQTEQDVFASAFAPGAGDPRPLAEPRDPPSAAPEAGIEREIFDSVWKD
jgi:hypothetical protein